MPCPDHEMLSAFADRELDASEAAMIERHLVGCAACREFVGEMVRLDACVRSALRTIHVAAPGGAITVNRALTSAATGRWLALAAAVVVLGTVALSIWFFASRPERGRVAEEPPAKVEAGFSDEAFERWAEPYRRLQIPLVPLEEVANYKFPEQEITRSYE